MVHAAVDRAVRGPFVRQKRRVLGLLLGIAGVAGLGWPLSPSGEGLLLISANVQAFSDGRVELERALAEEEADVVLLIEKRAEEIEGLVRVGDNFFEPTFQRRPMEWRFLSRWLGLSNLDLRRDWRRRSLQHAFGFAENRGEALCRGDSRSTSCSVLCHRSRTVHRVGGQKASRGSLARAPGSLQKGRSRDCNRRFQCDAGSRTLRSFTQRGFRDPQRYRGIYASSWPAGGGWPNFPVFRLDHVLVGDVEIDAVQQFRLPKPITRRFGCGSRA